MKKLFVLLFALGMIAVANAQMTGSTGGGYAGSAVTGGGSVTGGSAAGGSGIAYPSPVPPQDTGFVQFNNLAVQSVSSANPPAEILAGYNIYPIMGAPGGTGGSAPMMRSQNCYRFETQADEKGRAVPCPTPSTSAAPSASAPMPSATASPTTGASSSAAIPPQTTPSIARPSYYPNPAPYRIEVDAATRLYLRDRTPASLTDFTAGDQINVYGFYNTDGTIQAYLVRNLSKPAETETIQLNNVRIVSISAATLPATLAVVQEQWSPCYYFGTGGAVQSKQSYACPMGVSSFSGNPATENVTPPSALMPNWATLRKYVVNADAKTIVLDAQRGTLSFSDLKVGDRANIYGETSDNGQTVNADIIRDLSQPPVPATYRGTVTQVNADGSFVVQTQDGQTFTVQNPVQARQTVTVTGLLDSMKNVLSQISSLILGNPQYLSPGAPTPVPLPMMQGGAAPSTPAR